MDPGAFALLGSVSFFAGVTRLTMSLTVIMVEITNDIHQVIRNIADFHNDTGSPNA